MGGPVPGLLVGTGVPAPPHPSRVPSGFTLHRPHAHPREAGWGATLSTPTQASGLSWGYAGRPPSPGPGVRRVPAVAPCGEGRQAAHVLGGSPCPGRCRRVARRARPGHLGSEAEQAQWARGARLEGAGGRDGRRRAEASNVEGAHEMRQTRDAGLGLRAAGLAPAWGRRARAGRGHRAASSVLRRRQPARRQTQGAGLPQADPGHVRSREQDSAAAGPAWAPRAAEPRAEPSPAQRPPPSPPPPSSHRRAPPQPRLAAPRPRSAEDPPATTGPVAGGHAGICTPSLQVTGEHLGMVSGCTRISF